jgi:putative SOS response-associated peptidase YedK
MCTNYTPTKNTNWVKNQFGVALPADYPDEAYPGFLGPVVMQSQQSGRVACGLARFGLIPAWAKDEKISRHTYNARSETVAEKPSFRTAWRKRQFCLILADNFYEPNYSTGKAVRWCIQTQEPNPFGIAGIWDKWTDPATGELVVSFSMLTVNADEHEVMQQFHKVGDEKRTPVIIPQENYIQWLGADLTTATQMLSWSNMPELQAAPQPKRFV